MDTGKRELTCNKNLVLVTLSSGAITVGRVWNLTDRCFCVFTINGQELRYDVTHWMTLPQLSKP